MSKIVVATSGRNRYFIQFHVRVPMLVGRSQDFFLPLKPTSAPYLDELTPSGRLIITALGEIQGITRVGVNLHALSVHTSPAYELTEITPQVLEVIKNMLGYDSTMVVEETTMEALHGN